MGKPTDNSGFGGASFASLELEEETDVIVKLDDNPVVFEFNSYQNKIRYPLKYNLKKGTHSLYVQASDKVGNRSVLKGDFFIK